VAERAWLRNARFLALSDLKHQLRARETLLWTFLMPLVFFYFIGTVTGGSGGGTEAKGEIALDVGEDAGFLAGEVERRLAEREYLVVHEPDPDASRPHLAIPERFTERVLAGERMKLLFTSADEGMDRDYARLRVGRAVYTVLADLTAVSAAGEEPSPEAFARLDAHPRALTLAVSSAGERERIPQGFEQTVPGTLVMFTLLVLLTSGAVLIVVERSQGLLRRLASAPITRGEVVLGKWLGRMALGLVQIAFAMLAGTLLFGMDWGPDLAMVCVVLVAWAALAASLALLAGSLARSEGQAIALGVLATNVLAALGGCWWPIEITPSWMQNLALFLPTGWTMDALHQLVIFRHGAASALPHVLGLAAAAVVAGWAAARVFRYQ
jgi:ABC-2 type transport system permease protein